MARAMLFGLAAAAVLVAAAAGSPVLIPADSSAISWTGRSVVGADGSRTFDWEGTGLTFTVKGATVIALQISDQTAGGARFAVSLTQSGIPTLRTVTLLTSRWQQIYTVAAGRYLASTATVTATLLTEPQFIGDAPGANLTVQGIFTDGELVAPTPAPRRIALLGDSLTAGFGSGFDAPNGSSCAADTFTNDVTNTYGALLCRRFGADCSWVAQSGITLFANTKVNLPLLWNRSLGGVADSPTWNFSSWVPDAVLVNLGENDWNACLPNDCTPHFIADFTAAYVAFVKQIAAQYGNPSLQFFATIAPHEKGQSVGILPAIQQLTQAGYKVAFLNATVDESALPESCGGHPSLEAHALAAARAEPVVAQVMGWD